MSDFGDESGEKLFDWMMQVSMSAGESAMVQSAERLKRAFCNARTGLGTKQAEEPPNWAKLNLAEFQALPEFDSIRQAIECQLTSQGIPHQIMDDKGKAFLLFKVIDAPAVSEAFRRLEGKVAGACDKALEVRGMSRDQARDSTDLKTRADEARAASKALEAQRSRTPMLQRTEVRAK